MKTNTTELHYLDKDKKDKQGFITYIDFRVENGKADMWLYDIFPGVQLMLSDFETDSCFRNTHEQNVIAINHCKRGRFECVFDKQNILYMGEGDIALNSLQHLPRESSIPLGKFYGSSIIIFLEEAQKSPVWEEFEISFQRISEKYALDKQCHVFRRNEEVEHIYSEIYEHIQSGNPKLSFLRVKLVELLYRFQTEEIVFVENTEYLSKVMTDKIKHLCEHLTEQPDEKISLSELADEHGLSLTQLKKHFKDIYGMTPHAYRRIYRMNVAAKLLSETDLKISDIALAVSYKNPSKFSEAFLDVMGISPREYRMQYR